MIRVSLGGLSGPAVQHMETHLMFSFRSCSLYLAIDTYSLRVFQYFSCCSARYSLAACLLAAAFNFVFLYSPHWRILILDKCCIAVPVSILVYHMMVKHSLSLESFTASYSHVVSCHQINMPTSTYKLMVVLSLLLFEFLITF